MLIHPSVRLCVLSPELRAVWMAFAVSVALLTLWDMVKGIDSNLVIEGIRLLEKRKEPTT